MSERKTLLKHTPKCKWTEEEDLLLIKAVNQLKVLKWNKIAEIVGTRSGKQCRERWLTKIDPDINSKPQTPAEDEKLIVLHEDYGNNWTAIAKHFKGKTFLSVKNRWRSFNNKTCLKGLEPTYAKEKTRNDLTLDIFNFYDAVDEADLF